MIIQCPKTGRVCEVTGCTGCWKESTTQDEIIRMAREAGVFTGDPFGITMTPELERFAALVAAHEREKQAKHREGFWCEDLTCAKCYGVDFRLRHAAPRKSLSNQETVSGGSCGGCAKKATDGWALYCVECWEKAEQGPVKRFTSDDVKVAFENGYTAAMSVADIAKEAGQEPLMITPGGGAFPFAVVGELEQAEQEQPEPEGICQEPDGCPTEKAVLQRFWREKQAKQEPVAWMNKERNTITWNELYPNMTPLYAAPVRTKDLTDEELWEAAKTAKSNDLTDAFRAVIAADRDKNK